MTDSLWVVARKNPMHESVARKFIAARPTAVPDEVYFFARAQLLSSDAQFRLAKYASMYFACTLA
jgi:hypothetical protein